MPKSKTTKAIIQIRPPLKIDIAPSILKEEGPTRPPLKVEVEVAPSILKEGGPTRETPPNEPTEPTEPDT